MKLGHKATDPLRLLIGVLAELGVEFKRKHLDVGDRYLGINLHKMELPKLASLAEPDGAIAGWFGYESKPTEGPRLSIWLYCGRSSAIKRRAHERIKHALLSAGFDEAILQEDGSAIGVFCKAEDSHGDKEWFNSVLAALNN